ncbi:hypothetical protein PanWU01x14_371330, partial [Parasponia andersonii]
MRTIIDVVVGGALIGKSTDDAYELLEKIAANNYQSTTECPNLRRVTSINELEVIFPFTKNLESMTKKLHSMVVHGMHAIQSSVGACEQCGDNHLSSYYPLSTESAHFVGNYNQKLIS